MDINEHSRLYNAYYYSHKCGKGWGQDEAWFQRMDVIADRILSDIQPATVLDAGCAMGHLVRALRHKGIQAYGFDLSEFAIGKMLPEVRPFCWVGSITEPFPQKYDLIICTEVLEHLPRVEADKAIINLCHYSQVILFSSTPFDYKEATHFNVQPPEYWVKSFARQGFFRDQEFDASFIAPWAVLYRQATAPFHQIVGGYERHLWELQKENLDLRDENIRMRNELSSNLSTIDKLQSQLTESQAQINNSKQFAQANHQGGGKRFLRSVIDRLLRRIKHLLGQELDHNG
jgi:SAM-dependent methyltransferase